MTTLVSTIIQRAFRETNLIPVGQSPTSNQQTEALDLLNTLLLSTIGNEAGDSLRDLNVGGTYDQSDHTDPWVPDDVRLVFNITAPMTLKLDPAPYEGQRLAFIDIDNNLTTYPVTLDGNGRLIEGTATVLLNVSGDSRQWIYKGDTGTWSKVTSLLIGDSMPFAGEFDQYFVTMLAIRLNPRYSQQTSQETISALKRSRDQLRARFHNYRQVSSDLPGYGWSADPWGYWSTSNDEFNTGKPFNLP